MDESPKKRILVVAGEASGDAHGAKLVRELRSGYRGEIEFFGAVSHAMRGQDVEEIVNADQLSIVGLPEIARALPMFWSTFTKLRDTAIDRRADAAVLIDFPDFNLKLAKALRKRGIPVIYYISPQIWAWRQYRLKAIRRDVDLLLTILPFEKEWYAAHGFDRVEYVGNPTVREVHAERSREQFRNYLGFDHDAPLVALLPGSRHKEIVRILPEMLRSARFIAEQRPETAFVIAQAANRSESEIAEAFRASGIDPGSIRCKTVQGATFDAVNAADAAAVASGTATLETAILGTPMAIVYKSSALNYRLLRPLIDVEHFGLINLIAGERIAKELIQDDFSAVSLGDEILRILEPEENASFRARLMAATEKLGHGGASKRAADAIIRLLESGHGFPRIRT